MPKNTPDPRDYYMEHLATQQRVVRGLAQRTDTSVHDVNGNVVSYSGALPNGIGWQAPSAGGAQGATGVAEVCGYTVPRDTSRLAVFDDPALPVQPLNGTEYHATYLATGGPLAGQYVDGINAHIGLQPDGTHGLYYTLMTPVVHSM
jgi:hypothetical protein